MDARDRTMWVERSEEHRHTYLYRLRSYLANFRTVCQIRIQRNFRHCVPHSWYSIGSKLTFFCSRGLGSQNSHNAILLQRGHKQSGQAALNSAMEVKQNVLHLVYLHFKEKKGKSPSVTLIPHAFSKKTKYTLLCVFLYLQILAAKITSLHCIFPVLFGSIRAFTLWHAILRVWRQTFKKSHISH